MTKSSRRTPRTARCCLPDCVNVIATGVTLALAAAELESLLQNRRCLDFTGMLLRATQGLRDEHSPTDLALYWDYRIKHLLIDEFQDTSRSQYDFFALLTEGWETNDGNTFLLSATQYNPFIDSAMRMFQSSVNVGRTAFPMCP